uniref:Uncharacterized protein n=1 Tax=Knipowitschia caucasica TaxID=637954 RepID=A0AAV2IWS3_KNICA
MCRVPPPPHVSEAGVFEPAAHTNVHVTGRSRTHGSRGGRRAAPSGPRAIYDGDRVTAGGPIYLTPVGVVHIMPTAAAGDGGVSVCLRMIHLRVDSSGGPSWSQPQPHCSSQMGSVSPCPRPPQTHSLWGLGLIFSPSPSYRGN